MKPNPPRYCTSCRTRIPNRKDRKTELCRVCFAERRRCGECGQMLDARAVHRCASVDLRGPRHCLDCAKPLSNEGYERWKRRCGPCEKKRWREKERIERLAIKESFGGKCSLCGYDRCTRALHFHHTNGREDGDAGSVKVKELREYPERFQLVCANCHFEIHAAE